MDETQDTKKIRGRPFSKEHQPTRRKKGKQLKTLLLEALERVVREQDKTNGEILIESTVDAAIEGDAAARKIVFEYAIGKPKEQVEHTGEGGGPIKNRIVIEYVNADTEPADSSA